MTHVATYLSRLPENWQQKFLDIYDAGGSDEEIMREYSITPKAWKAMLLALGESDFAEVVEYGNTLAHAWWLSLGRANVGNKAFNTQLYNITMQNRFGWSQKAESTEHNTAIEMADEDTLLKRAKQLFEQVSGGAESN